MYYLKGFDQAVQTICRVLAHNVMDLSDDSLKLKYQQFLLANSVFSVVPKQQMHIVNIEGVSTYAPSYYAKHQHQFSTNSKLLLDRLNHNFFGDSLKLLNSQSSNLYQLSDFLIKLIVINGLKTYTEGTTEDTLGLSVMDFKDSFTQQDFIELVVHQLTHMLVFLDHIDDSHIDPDVKDKMIKTELPSKLGGNLFPAYIAFHSFIVGIEILSFRHETTGLSFAGNYHGTSKRIFRVCQLFKKALDNHLHLFNLAGQCLFDLAVDRLEALVKFDLPLVNAW